MSFVFVIDGQIVDEREFDLFTDPELYPPGYFEVVDVVKPADTPSVTWDRSVSLVEEVPTVVWIQRPKTPEELSYQIKALVAETLLTDISTLRAWAAQGRAATVTSGNAVATLGVLVKNVATFYDKFADLLTITMGDW